MTFYTSSQFERDKEQLDLYISVSTTFNFQDLYLNDRFELPPFPTVRG